MLSTRRDRSAPRRAESIGPRARLRRTSLASARRRAVLRDGHADRLFDLRRLVRANARSADTGSGSDGVHEGSARRTKARHAARRLGTPHGGSARRTEARRAPRSSARRAAAGADLQNRAFRGVPAGRSEGLHPPRAQPRTLVRERGQMRAFAGCRWPRPLRSGALPPRMGPCHQPGGRAATSTPVQAFKPDRSPLRTRRSALGRRAEHDRIRLTSNLK